MNMQNENIVSDLVFKQLQLDPANAECFDCAQAQPQWASVNNGTFICMNCAALHRSMGLQTSFVRSLSMDTWNMGQLKQMALGGNKKLKQYLQNYDLNDESVQQRYNTRAAEYYRLQLRSNCENIPFGDKQPSYEIGREQIPPDEIRSPEQMMGDMSLGSHGGQQDTSAGASVDVNEYLNQGYSYLSYGASKLQENATYAAQVAKSKASEAGVTDNVKYVQGSLIDLGSRASSTAVQTAGSLKESVNDGSLQAKATENATWAASSLQGFGSSLYKKAATLTGKNLDDDDGAPNDSQGQQEKPKDDDLIQFAASEPSNNSNQKSDQNDLIQLNPEPKDTSLI